MVAVNSVINFKARVIDGSSIEITNIGSEGAVSATELCRFVAAIVRHIAINWNQSEDKVWDKAMELSRVSEDTSAQVVQ